MSSGDSKAYKGLLLGEHSDYVGSYTPSLLQPIERSELRANLGLYGEILPFSGVDIWTAYEVSWLDEQGKPHVAVAEFQIPCDSTFLVESKSFKLYLNSLNQTVFKHISDVEQILESDLSELVQAPVAVSLKLLVHASNTGIGRLTGECIDELSVEIDHYEPIPEVLTSDPEQQVTEALHSHLLKTNCPVTGQPDWASVLIQYSGAKIDREALLKYIISYRNHQDFHEHCVERIFSDIKKYCSPERLTVYARYTRRGGLDINPFRTDCAAIPDSVRLVRQ